MTNKKKLKKPKMTLKIPIHDEETARYLSNAVAIINHVRGKSKLGVIGLDKFCIEAISEAARDAHTYYKDKLKPELDKMAEQNSVQETPDENPEK